MFFLEKNVGEQKDSTPFTQVGQQAHIRWKVHLRGLHEEIAALVLNE